MISREVNELQRLEKFIIPLCYPKVVVSNLDEFTFKVYFETMINKVEFSRSAKKDLKKVPKYIITKLLAWIDNVEEYGLRETSKIKGFHDEPLVGDRKGKRSIRSNSF